MPVNDDQISEAQDGAMSEPASSPGPARLGTLKEEAALTCPVDVDIVEISQPEFVEGSSSGSPQQGSPAVAAAMAASEHRVSPSPSPEDRVTPASVPVDAQFESLRAHKALLASFVPSLTCQVCLDLLHRPFTLAPCGYVACHSCLVNWFTAPPQEPDPLPVLSRRKTCPHCRAVVRERPTEVRGIKDMVAALVSSGLAPDFPPPPADNAERDPWAGIFRDPTAPAALDGPMGELGMWDAEDDCYRCLDDNHELVEGKCTHCDRVYIGHLADYPLFDDLEEDEDDRPGWLPTMAQMLGFGVHHSDDEHSSDEDHDGVGSDDGYGGSFIDDGEEGHGVNGEANEVIEISSDEEGEGRARRGNRRGAAIIVSDEEDGSDADVRVPPRGRRAVIRLDVSDDEDEGYSVREVTPNYEEDDGSIARPPHRLAHLLNPVEDDHASDSDHSEASRATRASDIYGPGGLDGPRRFSPGWRADTWDDAEEGWHSADEGSEGGYEFEY
ncbi:hypothetical protein BV25DRAFT_1831253 [Artomyces pyxidatus]|uniref:Uncharacterized protein n=1 Tax=Artomyces pyxidatus TaxID=48021 RepID=A0ACB8SM25_9AGAM|nr:hypothetical protein BV25DRAFT_1831253 [Artomyces pyxidatus]